MEEDLEFNRFLKKALESEPEFTVPRAAVCRPALLSWTIPSFLAASFALAVILHATFMPSVDRVSETIELLSLADGLSVEGASTGDLLLAWQDAPCLDIL